MSAPRNTHALSPAAAGLAWGLIAAAIWTVYSVLARLGIKSGLTPFDMTLLRFMPGALVMLPFVWRWGWRDMAGIGWRRGRCMKRPMRLPACIPTTVVRRACCGRPGCGWRRGWHRSGS